jgi:hypothetical protein
LRYRAHGGFTKNPNLGLRMNLLRFHKISDMFPLMRSDESETLRMDIATHGRREPICLYECKILDGRNRYRACFHLKIEPRFCEWRDDGHRML